VAVRIGKQDTVHRFIYFGVYYHASSDDGGRQHWEKPTQYQKWVRASRTVVVIRGSNIETVLKTWTGFVGFNEN
jgi:hypothetical protein